MVRLFARPLQELINVLESNNKRPPRIFLDRPGEVNHNERHFKSICFKQEILPYFCIIRDRPTLHAEKRMSCANFAVQFTHYRRRNRFVHCSAKSEGGMLIRDGLPG